MKHTHYGIFVVFIIIAGCHSTPTPPTDVPWENPPSFEDRFCTPVTFTAPKEGKIPFMSGGHDFIKRPGPFVWDARSTIDTVSSDGNWLLSVETNAVTEVEAKKKGWKKGKKDEHEKTQLFSDRVTVYSLTDPEAPPVRHDFSSDTSRRISWTAFTPDNVSFLVCRQTLPSSLTLHDRATGEVVRKFPIKEPITAGAVAPNGETVALAQSYAIEFWNLRTGQRTALVLMDRNPGIGELRFSQDGKFLFAATPGKHLKVYDLVFYNEIASFPADIPCNFDISPDSRLLMIARPEESKSLEVTREEGFETKKHWAAFAFGSRLQFYEIGTWRLLWESAPRNRADYAFRSIRFSKDGQSLLAAGNRSEPKLNSVMTKTSLCRYDLRQHGGDWMEEHYRTLPLHPDGKFLLGGRKDSVAILSPWESPDAINPEMK